MIDDNDISILEKIIAKDGSCLDAEMCAICPFASKCLPQFLNHRSNRPSKNKRVDMALDALAKYILLDDSQEFVIDK